jgi:hypothetical protein
LHVPTRPRSAENVDVPAEALDALRTLEAMAKAAKPHVGKDSPLGRYAPCQATKVRRCVSGLLNSLPAVFAVTRPVE